MDRKKHTLTLSIKAREIDEDKQALETFGSTESGASLGDILGAALSESGKGGAADAEDKPKKKAASKAKKSDKKDEADEAE